MTAHYTLEPKQKAVRLVDSIHETRIDPPSKHAFRALGAAQGLSMRAALTQLVEQHARIRQPFQRVGPLPWGIKATNGDGRYTSILPAFQVAPDVSMALLIDANRAGIRLTEAVRQLVWRCVRASS